MFMDRIRKWMVRGKRAEARLRRSGTFRPSVELLETREVPTHGGGLVNPAPEAFVHAQGQRLVVGPEEQEVWLRGINYVRWFTYEGQIYYHDGDPQEYQTIADMGMNTVRLPLHYQYFEDDTDPFTYRPEGWAFVDQQIEYARDAGLFLVLDLHVPPGGPVYYGEDHALWTGAALQERTVALWQGIAERYADEPVIAGYDLLNEPLVPAADAWPALAQQLVDTIRSVDPNHLLIVEQLSGVYRDWEASANLGVIQFTIDDPGQNVMYDFHFYQPFSYTHQWAPWLGSGEGGAYPAPVQFPTDLVYAENTEGNPAVPPGDSGWQWYDGVLHQPYRNDVVAAYPAFFVSAGSGTIYFDDFVVREYDPQGNYVREVLSVNIESADGWQAFGEPGAQLALAAEGFTDGSSLSIANVADFSSWQNPDLRFEVRPDHSYEISGAMRGANVADNGWGAMALIFERSIGGGAVQPFDIDFLRYEVGRYRQFGRDHNVPMNVGEFGPSLATYEDGRGGLDYLRDLLQVMTEEDLNYAFYAYELLVSDYDGNPEVHQDLIDALRDFHTPQNLVGPDEVADLPPPLVQSIAFRGGRQRSLIRSVTITFSRPVFIDAGAFTLVRTNPRGRAIAIAAYTPGVYTAITLTFAGGSLADGNYRLTINSDRIRDPNSQQALDGNADGRSGGNRTAAFFRFFGDSDSDRDVDRRDQRRFSAAYSHRLGQAGYRWYFDFDANGVINRADWWQFRARLGRRLAR